MDDQSDPRAIGAADSGPTDNTGTAGVSGAENPGTAGVSGAENPGTGGRSGAGSTRTAARSGAAADRRGAGTAGSVPTVGRPGGDPGAADCGDGPLLQLRGICRSFGHVRAVHEVDVDLHRGEILGIVGDNGAGKSTLMKIIAGTVIPDSGRILMDGEAVEVAGAADSRRLGIEMIYQDLALFDNLDVAANVFIGREATRGLPGLLGFLERRRMHREAAALLERLNIMIGSTRLPVGVLSGGQRQMVAIARAVAFEANNQVLLMDEPSAALGATESATVLELIREIRRDGLSIMIISHRIPEVLELVDRVMVMKRGERVATLDARDTTVEECVNLIVAGAPAAPDQA